MHRIVALTYTVSFGVLMYGMQSKTCQSQSLGYRPYRPVTAEIMGIQWQSHSYETPESRELLAWLQKKEHALLAAIQFKDGGGSKYGLLISDAKMKEHIDQSLPDPVLSAQDKQLIIEHSKARKSFFDGSQPTALVVIQKNKVRHIPASVISSLPGK